MQQGAGITVTGDGTAGSPYVVTLDGTALARVTAADGATINFTVTGDGSAGSPYVITGEVIDGTVTPNTNATLDLAGAKAGHGLDYNPTTRVTDVAISASTGSALSFGTDDGLYALPGWVTATVTSTSPLQVTALGATGQTAVKMPAYTPVNGDTVYAIPSPNGFLLLGKTT